MTVATPYLYALALAVGLGAGWQANEWRHGSNSAKPVVEQATRVVEKVVVDRAETERIRGEYLEFKDNAYAEIARLKRSVDAGNRLRVNAKCLPAPGADASGASAGTAELDPQATEDYFSYERDYAEQFALLQLCRNELIKRSSK